MDPLNEYNARLTEDGEVVVEYGPTQKAKGRRKKKKEEEVVEVEEPRKPGEVDPKTKREVMRKLACFGHAKRYVGRDFTLAEVERLSDKKVDEYFEVYKLVSGKEYGESVYGLVCQIAGKGATWMLPVRDEDELVGKWKENVLVKGMFNKRFEESIIGGNEEVAAVASGLSDLWSCLDTSMMLPTSDPFAHPIEVRVETPPQVPKVSVEVPEVVPEVVVEVPGGLRQRNQA